MQQEHLEIKAEIGDDSKLETVIKPILKKRAVKVRNVDHADDSSFQSTSHCVSANKRLKKKSTKIERWDQFARVKPDPPAERELERRLVALATKGVVQLFNAVKQHQSGVNRTLSVTKGVRKSEQALAATTKRRNFLEKLSKNDVLLKKPQQSSGRKNGGEDCEEKIDTGKMDNKRKRLIKIEQEDLGQEGRDSLDVVENDVNVGKFGGKNNNAKKQGKLTKLSKKCQQQQNDGDDEEDKWDVLKDDFLMQKVIGEEHE